MSKTFHLTIAHVSDHLYDGEARSVMLPGEEGQFTVMAGHEAFVTPLVAGTAVVETPDGEKKEFPITTGVAEVSSGQATVLL